MFNSVALDIVIGLVFIYLLYSLLATILSELIATGLGLRARNLKEAVDRMLNDEKPLKWWRRLVDTLNLTKSPKNPVVNAFYENPEIKYLGSSGLFKTPSNFKAGSFSKTLLSLLFGKDKATRDIIESKINNLTVTGKDKKGVLVTKNIDEATAEYIRGLWLEAQGDVDKFKLHLEGWFDRTMEHTIEWYKRKMRVVTLILGLLIAWFFNADTIVIVKNLSTDKQARDQMVSMANAYIESGQYSIDTAKIKNAKEIADLNKRMDTLLAIKGQLEADIGKANDLLGAGSRLPDKVVVGTDSLTKKKTYTPPVNLDFLPEKYVNVDKGVIDFTCWDHWHYLFWLLGHHFIGFLITAIAISLGAPFWFDLLSKMMSLKTSKKADPNGTNNTDGSNSQPITVNVNTKDS
jgi:hypothetical protein